MTLGKIVTAHPLNEMVLAVPYRSRPIVHYVSVPPALLKHARQCGATSLVVRFDECGECFRLLLAEVDRVGWLHESDGRPEWFLPISAMAQTEWQQWPFVTDTVEIGLDDDEPPGAGCPSARQLRLWPEREGGAA